MALLSRIGGPSTGSYVISFIIPTYNEKRLLGCTLAAIKDATVAAGEPFKLVVVDDDSTDRSADVARQHGVRVVPVRHRQIAATRNSGGLAGGGELLVFVDADTVVNEGVVRATSRSPPAPSSRSSLLILIASRATPCRCR